jgi:hypothetical protein
VFSYAGINVCVAVLYRHYSKVFLLSNNDRMHTFTDLFVIEL